MLTWIKMQPMPIQHRIDLASEDLLQELPTSSIMVSGSHDGLDDDDGERLQPRFLSAALTGGSLLMEHGPKAVKSITGLVKKIHKRSVDGNDLESTENPDKANEENWNENHIFRRAPIKSGKHEDQPPKDYTTPSSEKTTAPPHKGHNTVPHQQNPALEYQQRLALTDREHNTPPDHEPNTPQHHDPNTQPHRAPVTPPHHGSTGPQPHEPIVQPHQVQTTSPPPVQTTPQPHVHTTPPHETPPHVHTNPTHHNIQHIANGYPHPLPKAGGGMGKMIAAGTVAGMLAGTLTPLVLHGAHQVMQSVGLEEKKEPEKSEREAASRYPYIHAQVYHMPGMHGMASPPLVPAVAKRDYHPVPVEGRTRHELAEEADGEDEETMFKRSPMDQGNLIEFDGMPPLRRIKTKAQVSEHVMEPASPHSQRHKGNEGE